MIRLMNIVSPRIHRAVYDPDILCGPSAPVCPCTPLKGHLGLNLSFPPKEVRTRLLHGVSSPLIRRWIRSTDSPVGVEITCRVLLQVILKPGALKYTVGSSEEVGVTVGLSQTQLLKMEILLNDA